MWGGRGESKAADYWRAGGCDQTEVKAKVKAVFTGLESGVESWGPGRGGIQEQGLDNVAQILEETQR